ncbi:MAG: hypothetical protein QOF49_314 [Chloroflexota bacterium]|jgi:ATP-dependent DNA ligase|nr:hypothetical protein [Chloroflexota bacterium]
MPTVAPPIAPMLARLTREIPIGSYTYEPKWDGFRCLAFVDHGTVDLRSRHDRPLARYFPEIVEAFERVRGEASDGDSGTFVLDGEIVLVASPMGVPPDVEHAPPSEPDFARLMSRLHPAASRVALLRREMPAQYVAFDILAHGGDDLRSRPFAERRAVLERRIDHRDESVVVTPATRDLDAARSWLDSPGQNVDGVVAKDDELRYLAGKRAMIKVKRQRTADCVVAGVRPTADGAVSSLLLGLYDDAGELRHVGVVTQLARAERIRLLDDLRPLIVNLQAHPWRNGFLIGASPLGRLKGSASRWMPGMELDWLPLRPELVVEVGFDQVDGDRFRHPAQLLRWRPDRSASSCQLGQIVQPAGDVEEPDGTVQ